MVTMNSLLGQVRDQYFALGFLLSIGCGVVSNFLHIDSGGLTLSDVLQHFLLFHLHDVQLILELLEIVEFASSGSRSLGRIF